ncbi:MAG: aromatic-ring-hydroxylating dioxygenase subunit beta [Burkholderiales bacterium]|nr:aromatic-ring-hydroxylating dioxygenase subunit beta [Burkholderiales bacterium]
MITRAEVEDFLFHEAALLDEWRLDEWLALLTDDARYRVPSNDAPSGDPADTLFLIADDIHRIRGRVARLKDPHAHAEFPHSRTRRIITNVRVIVPGTNSAEFVPGTITVHANFVVHRFRRGGQASQFVGRYRYALRRVDGALRIALREAILDSEELGGLGAVSFIL